MSVQEIQDQLASLPVADLERVERFIRLLRHTQRPGWHEGVAEADARMDAGEKFYEADLQRLMSDDAER